MLTPALEEKLDLLPTLPGVYLWKDADGVVIYVGKAKVLRNRVRSYHQQADNKDLKTRIMVSRAADVDWIITDSEKAALILENTLIKKHRPRFNILLRDDKNFLAVKLTVRETWPRLYLVRRIVHDGSVYFGPFSDAGAARATFGFLNRHFPLRECSDRQFASRTRPCLNYQIGRSAGPCCGMVTSGDYARIVAQVRMFFDGKGWDLVRELEREMEHAAEALRFEQAARARDLVAAITKTLTKQQAETTDLADRDVFGIYREGASGVVLASFTRGGKTIGQRAFVFTNQEEDDDEVIGQVVQGYYAADGLIPAEIIVPARLGEMHEAVEEWLTDLRGQKVTLRAPQRGDRVRWVELAAENAKQQFEVRRNRLADAREILDGVARSLDLPRAPIVVECFDISNVQGQNAVASQVTFVDGKPDKNRYRHYRIRTKDTPDDYAMMREALERRIERGQRDGEWPDLLFVDGGRGHLAVAESVLRDRGVTHLPIAAITKIREQDADDPGPEDKVFLPGRKNPVTFRRGSTSLYFIQRVRDEAHRFAIEYHRKLRGKSQVKSALDEIEGVGKARKKALVAHFGSMKKLREAGADAIAAVPGIGADLAARIAAALSTPHDAAESGE